MIDWVYSAVLLGVILLIFSTAATFVPILVWLERRGAAFIQNRLGPNRVGPLGLLQPVADAVKLLFKEDFIPTTANPFLYMLAPALVIMLAFLAMATIPFGGAFTVMGQTYFLQISNVPIGLLYVLAVGAFSVYGIILGGWSSNNKYALMGSMRASSQMVSYEIALGIGVATVILLYGTFDLREMVDQQGANVLSWGVVHAPLTFIVLLITVFAETNRLPFDLAEGEAEIVGFHVEYASMKFALYFMAEYVHMFVGSSVLVCLFFGGWYLPGLDYAGLSNLFLSWGLSLDISSIVVVAVQFAVMVAKISLLLWFFIWVRWSYPRLRYDQLMRFGWKGLIPLSLISFALTAIIVYWRVRP